MEQDNKLVQRSIYIGEQEWQQLRRMALDHGTTASSLVASATTYFLSSANDKTKATIIEHAQQRAPGVPARRK